MTTTEIAIAVGLTVTVIGCMLGLRERAVIFRNYDDLGLVFLAVVPLFIGFGNPPNFHTYRDIDRDDI
jgi:hypothetical protein